MMADRWIPICSVEVVNGECPSGWEYIHQAHVVLTAADIYELLGAGLVPLTTAYVFKRIIRSIQDRN